MSRREAWAGSSLSASWQLPLPLCLLGCYLGPDIGGLSSLGLQFLVPRFGDMLEGGHGSCSPGPFPHHFPASLAEASSAAYAVWPWPGAIQSPGAVSSLGLLQVIVACCCYLRPWPGALKEEAAT